MLEIIQLPVLRDNYIYVLHDSRSAETAVIDPAEAVPVLDLLARKGWQLHTVLNTHHHSDHVGGNIELKRKTGCTVIASHIDAQRIPALDTSVSDGDIINVGSHQATVIATAGHTLGHIIYHFADDKLLFCGDTLFAMGCGRLFEGSAAQLWQSLAKIKVLPHDTLCYCAHEYTLANAHFALKVEPDNQALHARIIEIQNLRAQGRASIPTTIAQELATNPFLREHSVSLQKSIQRVNASPVEIFTELRRLKDNV